MDDPLWEIMMEELQKESVFLDEEVLSSQYIPKELPHREDKIRELALHFKQVILNQQASSKRVLITGPVGSGKTSLAKAFGKYVLNAAKSFGVTIRYVHLNCRVRKNAYLVILAIARAINPSIPLRGHSKQELLEATLDYLIEKKEHMIVTLDEFESLPPRIASEVLYSLLRGGEDKKLPYLPLSIILVSRFLSIITRLDPSTRSSFQSNIIFLKAYTKEQLRDILKYRIKKAFKEGTIGEATFELLLEIAKIQGNARFALELLWTSGKVADSEGSKEVLSEHVRKAKLKIDPTIERADLESLSFHQLLIVTAVARLLTTHDAIMVPSESVYNEYSLLCMEQQLSAEPFHRVEAYIKNLDTIGILRLDRETSQVLITEYPLSKILDLYERSKKDTWI